MKNNFVEAYALIQGIHIATENKVTSLNMIGDSVLLIQHVGESSPKDKAFDNLMKRIWKTVKETTSPSFFHMLHELNYEVDNCANRGCKLGFGDLNVNG